MQINSIFKKHKIMENELIKLNRKKKIVTDDGNQEKTPKKTRNKIKES